MRIQKAVIFAWVVASLLWAALVFLWARSYVVREIASVKPIGDAGRRVEVSTSRGEIALTVDYDASRRGQPRRWFHKAQPHDDSLPRFSFEDLAAITYHSTYWSGGGFGFMSAKPPDNPLLRPWTGPYGGVPPFGDVRVEHFRPGMDAVLQQTREEMNRIAENPDPPTFENTMVRMEAAGRQLQNALSLYGVFAGT